MPLFGVELKIDHATIAGRDLAAMQRALKDAGIPSESGGPHANHATEMALVSFPDGSYLELIAIQAHADPDALAAHAWHKFLEGNAGPCAWAVRPDDLSAEALRLRGRGVAVTPVIRNGRRRPDGVELQWETVQAGEGDGNFLPFMIHDFTPRARRAFPSGSPTTTNYKGVSKIVLGVRDLDAAIKRYEDAYGLPAPITQEDARFGARLAWFADTPVVLAAPLTPQSWLAARIARFGEAPCAFILQSARPRPASGSAWFGRPVSWLSPGAADWRLGVE
jgi:hypothetical protein